MRLVARDYKSSSWIAIEFCDGLIASVEPAAGRLEAAADDPWVAPAFWDIQNNGCKGHSYSGPDLTIDQAGGMIREQGSLGTARICPTLITAPLEHMLHGLRTISAACERYPDVVRRVIGIHVEGPFISEREGYRGAHPEAAIRNPSWPLFEQLQEAAAGRIVLVTLAPERDGAIDFIRQATSAGVVIAIGHTAGSESVIRDAAAAGARLSTHLGNGIAAHLRRHPNPIWVQAALEIAFGILYRRRPSPGSFDSARAGTRQGAKAYDLDQRCQPAFGSAARAVRGMVSRAVGADRGRRHRIPGGLEPRSRGRDQ